MSEFSPEFSSQIPITPISAFKHREGGSWSGSSVIKCEECPAGKVCKRISNFRESCPDGKNEKMNKNGWDRPEKCLAGVILLLDRFLERTEAAI